MERLNKHIILTDCKLLSKQKSFANCQIISQSLGGVKKYNDSPEVVAIVGSRALCRECQSLNFPNCHFFQLTSTGYDDIDLNVYKQKKITLCNAKKLYDECVAEYAVYMMLSYAKRYHRSLKNRTMRPLRNYHYMSELRGKTVGILGVGNIGSTLARILNGFSVDIVGYAEHTTEKTNFRCIYHRDRLDEFLSKCDFIINTLPETYGTIGLLGDEQFASMKPTSVFVNVGRDSVYNIQSLVHYYKEHRDAVAILDIFELIPNPFSSLRRLSNVYITPRIAAYSKESDEALLELIFENLNAYLNGKALKNILTKKL